MPSFNQVTLPGLCLLKLCRKDFKKAWRSNGKTQFPIKITDVAHNKLFILMKSNHEYQIMEHFLAALCQNVIPQNKIE